MLPDFDEFGNLPPGIYRCTPEEVLQRFGQGSPEREVETKELVRFIQWAIEKGVRRLMVNGSYITNKKAPNDVDIVILPGENFSLPDNQEVLWPFLHVLVAADEADLRRWVDEDFGTDRAHRRKGIVEVIL